MPQDTQGNRRCVNHYDQLLGKESGRDNWYHALTTVKKGADNKMKFNPTKGIAIAAWVCPQCGYVELYAMTRDKL